MTVKKKRTKASPLFFQSIPVHSLSHLPSFSVYLCWTGPKRQTFLQKVCLYLCWSVRTPTHTHDTTTTTPLESCCSRAFFSFCLLDQPETSEFYHTFRRVINFWCVWTKKHRSINGWIEYTLVLSSWYLCERKKGRKRDERERESEDGEWRAEPAPSRQY